MGTARHDDGKMTRRPPAVDCRNFALTAPTVLVLGGADLQLTPSLLNPSSPPLLPLPPSDLPSLSFLSPSPTVSPSLPSTGNEGHGLRSAVENACREMITIAPQRPLPVGFDSLNVAVATGVLLHCFQRTHTRTRTE